MSKREEVLKIEGEFSAKDLQEKLSIKQNHACILLNAMQKAGDLVRSGTRRHYKYTVAQKAATAAETAAA